MILWMDNKGGVDFLNGWSIAGQMRPIAIRLAFLRELKEEGVLEIRWIKGGDNSSDLFTKNVDGMTFEKHELEYCTD